MPLPSLSLQPLPAFFHSEIQRLLPMDLVSSSAAEFMVSTEVFAFWYFLQSDATADNNW
jgi:hypothetical protein